MPNFETRMGVSRKTPPRTEVEVAPPRLRKFLRDTLVEEYGTVGAYTTLADELGISSENIFSADWAEPRLRELIDEAEWIDVYELIEKNAPGPLSGLDRYDEQVTEILAREGVAYELLNGEFFPYDPESEQLGIETENPVLLDDAEFAPVYEQFGRALSALNAKPADNLTAVRESLNALEAAVRIITGKPAATLGAEIGSLLGNQPHRKVLTEVIKKLYGYSSTVPGARHGQHETVEVKYPEAAFAVRSAGAAIAMVIAESRRG